MTDRREIPQVREGDPNARPPYFTVVQLMGPDPDPLRAPDYTDPEPLEPAASPSSRRLPCLGALGVALVSALGVVWALYTILRAVL